MFLFLYVIGVIRLLSPFDFFFAQGIPVKNWYASVFEILFIKDFLFFPFSVSALIFLVFSSVSLFKLLKLLYMNIMVRQSRLSGVARATCPD